MGEGRVTCGPCPKCPDSRTSEYPTVGDGLARFSSKSKRAGLAATGPAKIARLEAKKKWISRIIIAVTGEWKDVVRFVRDMLLSNEKSRVYSAATLEGRGCSSCSSLALAKRIRTDIGAGGASYNDDVDHHRRLALIGGGRSL